MIYILNRIWRTLKSDSDNQRRFMKMFATDEEIHNQDSQQIMLPIWVPILLSVLTGFAMGIGNCRNKVSSRNFRDWNSGINWDLMKALVTVVAKKCGRKTKGKFKMSASDQKHRKSIASRAKTAVREKRFNAIRRNMQNMWIIQLIFQIFVAICSL